MHGKKRISSKANNNGSPRWSLKRNETIDVNYNAPPYCWCGDVQVYGRHVFSKSVSFREYDKSVFKKKLAVLVNTAVGEEAAVDIWASNTVSLRYTGCTAYLNASNLFHHLGK